ncbi:hypothetical protein CUU66_02120 [Peribacillus deserti]|uniref:Uncharacterized protein n=1 Tax=Peribacillus deserti TaxID=673318 RepID=A0A2N5MAW2_9BACI|nr:hypothetical protein CUU66_02120 [Peribacillus deserti]
MNDSSFKCFYFGKIKTDVIKIIRHYVFMHLRPSSTGLRDAPHTCEEQNGIRISVHTGCDILHKSHYIT